MWEKITKGISTSTPSLMSTDSIDPQCTSHWCEQDPIQWRGSFHLEISRESVRYAYIHSWSSANHTKSEWWFTGLGQALSGWVLHLWRDKEQRCCCQDKGTLDDYFQSWLACWPKPSGLNKTQPYPWFSGQHHEYPSFKRVWREKVSVEHDEPFLLSQNCLSQR